MKYIKMLSLAAVAALALMAFGAGTASATELYSGATTLKAGTEISASLATGTSANLTTTEGTVLNTCTTSSLNGKTSNTGSATETVKGSVEASKLLFSNCSNGAVTTTEGGELEIHHIAKTINGQLTAKGFKVTVSTIFGSCVFTAGAGTTMGTLTRSTSGNATMHVDTVVTRVTGLCPSSAKWVATYTVTSPTPLHVTAS